MSVVLTWTKRSTDACAAASRMFRVPCTLIREISCAVPQSDTMAPQWTTKRQPSMARRSDGASVRSPTAISTSSVSRNDVSLEARTRQRTW